MGPGNRLELYQYLVCRGKAVAIVLACLIPLLSSCNQASESRAGSDGPVAQTVTFAERKPTLPACPNVPYPAQPAALGAGHHKVFLKWNASTSANPANPNSVGYCLYRTQASDASKRCPHQADCEQVTALPVSTTRCVDDLVKDNTKYLYVAIAINAEGKISSPTKPAIAKIPAAGQQNPAPSDAASYPACRAPSSPSQGPHE